MATCRECIHNNVCETLALEYEISNETSRQVENRLARNCDDFINKSDYVKRKRGKWIPTPWFIVHDCDKCSVCGRKMHYGRNYNFCPNCGADMRKEENNG